MEKDRLGQSAGVQVVILEKSGLSAGGDLRAASGVRLSKSKIAVRTIKQLGLGVSYPVL